MTVYVVQQHHRKDSSGNLVPVFDFSSAEQYGELEFLLHPHDAPWDTESLLARLRDKSDAFRDGDYLILCGNPILIALCAIVMGEVADRIVFLQWSGSQKAYIPVECDLSYDQ